MMTNRFMNAMEYIGDDLIDRAAADMETPAPRAMAVWTKSIAAAACISLIVGGVYAGMWYWNGTENVGTDSPENAGSSSAIAPVQTTNGSVPATSNIDPNSYLVTMEVAYPYHEDRTVFAKMKIDEYLGVFVNDSDDQYLLIKCTVLQDYYDTIKSGTQITLAVRLACSTSVIEDEFVVRYYEEQVVTNFLSQFDYMFVFTRRPMEYYDFYSLETHERFDMPACSWVFLNKYDILPVSDGELDLHSLRAFWKEQDANYIKYDLFSRSFWMYVQDGVSAERFAEYIRENKERQIGGTQ